MMNLHSNTPITSVMKNGIPCEASKSCPDKHLCLSGPRLGGRRRRVSKLGDVSPIHDEPEIAERVNTPLPTGLGTSS